MGRVDVANRLVERVKENCPVDGDIATSYQHPAFAAHKWCMTTLAFWLTDAAEQ